MKTIRSIFILAAVFIAAGACREKTDALSEEESVKAAGYEIRHFVLSEGDRLKAMWENRKFVYREMEMPIKVRIFGEKPADGRSLFLSMHGGGSCPSAVNDQQWENQIKLYQPQEGVYIAPRAPVNSWNMWFVPEIDELFQSIILSAHLCEGVNPDKVYLLGYSAGGDGVWRLAPRMADTWAAASMMAGHPGDAYLLNLRNTPFMIWMGEQDSAYKRNIWAVRKGRELDSLQQNDPQGYIHETHIVKGKGHWMDRKDTLAIGWMTEFKRDPYPEKIVWKQSDKKHRTFYWIGADSSEIRKGNTVIVSRRQNTVSIEHCDCKELTIFLNDRFMDLDAPVAVKYKGKEIFNRKVSRTATNIRETLKDRKDTAYIFPARLDISLPDAN